MNKDRIDRLVDYLEKLDPSRFRMFDHKPMSEIALLAKRRVVSGSLSSHVVGLFLQEAEDAVRARKCGGGTNQLAQHLLGLDVQQAGDLFVCLSLPASMVKKQSSVTKEMAITALKSVRDTGEVRWY